MARDELLGKSSTARRIIGFHTTPEAAGKLFAELEPKLAVFTHVVLLTTDPTISAPSVDDVLARTRSVYSGRLAMGEDLMTIAIGDSVRVVAPGSQ